MQKFNVKTTEGLVQVEGRKFAHHVDGVRFWFICHEGIGAPHTIVITHYLSGKRVLDVSLTTRIACCGDNKAAAKRELDRLVERAGAAKMRAVLQAAEAETL